MIICAFLLFLLRILIHAQVVLGTFNCANVKYTTINNVRRSTTFKSSSPYLCDRGIIVDDMWYRFDSLAGNTIPESNPGLLRCGTYAPIWLNGQHPTNENVVVDVKACAAVPFVAPPGCGDSYNIKVVKCPGGFYLYRLKEPKQCSLAYCAGSKKPVKCSTTGDTLPVCPGVVPAVKSITTSFVVETTAFVRLQCVWEYDGESSIVEFDVRWIGDELDSNRRINRIFKGNEKWQYFYEHESAGKGPFDPPNTQNYAFNKEAFCEIRSRYKGGTWSKWKRSKKIFTGITVHPSTIKLEECGKEKERKIFVTLTPYLPIREKDFRIDIDMSKSHTVDKVCLRGVASSVKTCQVRLVRDKHSSNSPLRIILRTSCSRFTATAGFSDVTLKLPVPVLDQHNNPFWIRYTFPEIKIFITKSTKKVCKSETDPHFTTFDGRYYNFYGIGTFLLYQNKHIGTRVEARQKSCNGGFASCNCGIAIKEGPFYKIFDMCQVQIINGQAWWQNPKNLIIRKRELEESQTNGFYTVKTETGSTTTYEVYLPSGVVVTVKRMYWGLSTYVKAPTPYNQNSGQNHLSDGLCGNYNGDPNDDFSQGEEVKFGESNRINGASIFDYKGDPVAEKKVLEDCKTGEICSCEKNKASCGAKAIESCFPSDTGKHYTDVKQGLCDGPKKRDLTSRNDDIDDQDDIPPFNPPQQNITQVPSWPTPNGLTEKRTMEICNAKIRYSKAGESCSIIPGVDIDAVIKQCVSDIQATDNVAWATDNFEALQETCKKNIYKNTSYYQNSTDGELQLDTSFIAALCPNDCSGHGNCSNATCTCDEFYTAADCSISLKDRPFVSGIRKDGLCDVRRRPCRNIGIYGYPFLDSANLTCHIQELKVIESVWTPSNSTSLYPGKLVDLTEVKCSLPVSPVNIGDYDNEGVTAAGLKIAVSNNRINASEVFAVFITYDSVCQKCNTTTGCQLKTDACFIFGHCYAQNESHPTDWCQQCLPHITTTSWLERADNQQPSFTTSSILYAFQGKQLRVQLRAVDPEYRTIRYTFAQNETFGASLTESGIFTWTTNTNYSKMFIFKVTDECGAYSVLNTTVVIKKCPCQNSGECRPDNRDLDGAGNFTCLCSAGYTGVLCEIDVDECNISKPCFNGSCHNEQPGFSCSCFVGYTGDLCQTEVDECASNPCFLEVKCTDMIGSFNCGPCPSGYSGNGQNCSRIDGNIDKCIANPTLCHSEAKCAYHNGSFVCKCTKGYKGDGTNNCTDINECVDTPDICHQNANCINTVGNYSCECLKGFTGDGYLNCSDVNECVENSGICHPNADCTNTAGNYSCECLKGFTGDGYFNCSDINECVDTPNICHQNANCINTLGNYSCECWKGFTGDGYFSCSDVNECMENPGICHQNANCGNTVGNYSCECLKGFSGDGYSNCSDVNECMGTLGICHQNANCINIVGNYSCECLKGFTGDGHFNCSDINECVDTPNICHQNANCNNTAGSYSCECWRGFTGDGFINCSDVNECMESPGICHQNANCINTVGNYSCECLRGFTGDGYFNCSDINECVDTPNICHQNANCINTDGNYSCECWRGFTGDGNFNCSDIDECLTIPNICHQFAICSNVPGSYSCHCGTGFSGNGKLNCDDINECQQAPSVCHRLSKCTNTEGSFSCQCDKGFTGDGIVNCTDINECSQSHASVCHQHAKCTNTIGSFSCQCNQGFFGNGIQNCTENQSPWFTIPNSVYAVLNNDFKIKMVAVDPENQSLTFTLLSNGTLTTAARIWKNLLTVSNLKENGTVYVQVEDEMGAKNVLILHVNAFECPCIHNGKCYQNKTIMYPVRPSDYLCECEDPYAGQRCGIRLNACDELPCYPGLKCYTAQNSEGFTCEECPTLFQGDGKQCELKPTEEKSSVASELTLTDQKWDDQLKTKTSDVYKKLVSLLTTEIRNVYKNHAEFSYVIIKGFRRGSIIVDFELIFAKKKVEDPFKPLMKAVEAGELGNMKIKMNTPDERKDEASEDKIIGLERIIFFVIVGAAAAFILIISVALYLRIKRQRTRREAKLGRKILSTSDKIPQGIAFQPTGQNSGEQINLNKFVNEGIHLEEEIKIQP